MQHKFLRPSATAVALAAALVVAPAAQQPLNLTDTIPFDSAVRTATLTNGLKYFVRHNEQPQKRVSLRLAVKAGSVNEADDQQGLAHLIEHMAFNGSAHFKPGELVSYFESTGARLGPHVNAYTSFDETVYMLDLPTDKPDIVAKGLTALADFAGGLTLDPVEIDKERGVVIEEWRGGLGAGSRIRDKQIPVLYFQSRYADRLPIGKPDIIRNAPAARLRAFYDTWYRPDHMALIVVGDVDLTAMDQAVRTNFGPLAARAPAAPEPNRVIPAHQQMLVSVASDPELTASQVQLVRKRAREGDMKVGDYRRGLVRRLMDDMLADRFTELARRPDAKFLAAGSGGGALNLTVDTFSLSARAPDGKIADALSAILVEAKRMREFGFSATELDRAKRSISAFYDRAFAERDKTESESFAQEYISFFLENEPSPGIAYERQLVQQVLPGITAADVSALVRTLLGDDSRVILATSPQKANVSVPTEADLRNVLAAAEGVTVTAWTDAPAVGALMASKPAAAAVTSRRDVPALGLTIVRFANGVEAWLKPTDFKNDQVVFALESQGGASLAQPAYLPEAQLSTAFVGLSGFGGIKPLDLQKLLAGKIAGAQPFVGLSTHGINGNAAPADLETGLQLLHQEFVAPNDDADAFALLKRQLGAQVANRGQNPQQVFGEALQRVTTSDHYTSKPLTPERVEALDRTEMASFYRKRFANANDFTFFMVGAFKVDDALPLLARYVGSLPSNPQAAPAKYVNVGITFPNASKSESVEKGKEPRGQTVLSFFAEPTTAPLDQEYVIAATTVLDIVLRDVLREDLGQTYTVGVGLNQALPQRGDGHIDVRFGAAPENLKPMVDRTLQEIRKLQQAPPSADLTNRAKESARRTYEESLRTNAYWLGRFRTVHLFGQDPSLIVTRGERIDSVTPQILQDTFRKYFPLDRYTVVTLTPEAGTPAK